MVEGKIGTLGKQGMDPDPVERVGAFGLFRVIILHRAVAPPAGAAHSLEVAQDRVARRKAKGKVGRHALIEPLGLVVDHAMDIGEAGAEQRGKQALGKGQKRRGVNVEGRQTVGPRHRMAGGTIGKRRQHHDPVAQSVQRLGHRQKINPGGQVLAVIFHHANRQHHWQVGGDGVGDLIGAHPGELHAGLAAPRRGKTAGPQIACGTARRRIDTGSGGPPGQARRDITGRRIRHRLRMHHKGHPFAAAMVCP